MTKQGKSWVDLEAMVCRGGGVVGAAGICIESGHPIKQLVFSDNYGCIQMKGLAPGTHKPLPGPAWRAQGNENQCPPQRGPRK